MDVAPLRALGFRLELEPDQVVPLGQGRRGERGSNGAIFLERSGTKRGAELVGLARQLPLQCLPLAAGRFPECLFHPAWKLLGQEGLHFIALQAEKPVDAKVEVGVFELEEVAQEVLEALE